MNALRKRNEDLFKGIQADAIILKTSDRFQDPSVSYYTGLGKDFLSGNMLLLKRGEKPTLFKSLLEPKITVPGIRVKRVDRKRFLEAEIKKSLKGVKSVGVNRPLHTTFSLRSLRKILGKKQVVDVSKQIALQRSVKSEEEVEKISAACRIAQGVSEKIPEIFTRGLTEKQLAMQVEFLLRERGENLLPFPVIVASSQNAAFPHHVPLDRKISKGLLLFDFGAFHDNYCSDISRVFCVGKPTRRQKRLYASVFAVKQFSQSQVRPGSVFGDVFSKASSFLKKESGFGLIHGLGHGLGVEVHDCPAGFLDGNKETVKENMVLTVEPGIYGKFGGIRIEDDVLVARRGCKLLTKAPTELISLS